MGRCRGGLTTKIHLPADEFGLPIDFRIAAGQVHDGTQAIDRPGGRKTRCVMAGKGYDSRQILDRIRAMGAVAVIASKSNRKRQRKLNKTLCRERNRIERYSSRLKIFRRFATRYQKLKSTCMARVAIACSCIHL